MAVLGENNSGGLAPMVPTMNKNVPPPPPAREDQISSRTNGSHFSALKKKAVTESPDKVTSSLGWSNFSGMSGAENDENYLAEEIFDLHKTVRRQRSSKRKKSTRKDLLLGEPEGSCHFSPRVPTPALGRSPTEGFRRGRDRTGSPVWPLSTQSSPRQRLLSQSSDMGIEGGSLTTPCSRESTKSDFPHVKGSLNLLGNKKIALMRASAAIPSTTLPRLRSLRQEKENAFVRDLYSEKLVHANCRLDIGLNTSKYHNDDKIFKLRQVSGETKSQKPTFDQCLRSSLSTGPLSTIFQETEEQVEAEGGRMKASLQMHTVGTVGTGKSLLDD